MTTAKANNLNLLKQLIQSGSPRQYLLYFKQVHEADIAENLSQLSNEEQDLFFKHVNPEIGVDVLEELELNQQIEILSKFKTDLAAKFIEEMEPDDAADLLEELSESNETQATEIINALPEKEKSDIQTLLSYEEDTAGALMTSEYLSIPENLRVKEALNNIKQQKPPTSELSYYIFITSKKHTLIGHVTLRDLVFADPNEKIKNLRQEHHISVNHHEDQENVAQLFQKYDMSVIPVVDQHDTLLGAITVDDVVDVVVDEATEDIYKLSGTSTDDKRDLISDNIFKPILYRLPWLSITILGGLLASHIINRYSTHFTPSLFTLSLSLSFIPLLMGLGGNVGNQSSAIIVRGLATGYINPKKAWSILGHELIVGIGIGSIISCIIFTTNYIIGDYSLIFSSIVAAALMGNICVAALLGTALPLLFHKLNIDPAIASAPFISTALDIIGQLIYFFITLSVLSAFT